MSKITTLAKPMPKDKAEAALRFAEAKPPSEEGRRVFFAPEGYRRLTINLPEALHKRLRTIAIERDTTATAIIEQLLEQHL